MENFKYLLEPRAIAIVGVSEDASRPGAQALRALRANGYAGKLYPVNPKYQEFDGLPCFASVNAIPEDVDLVIIGVPAKAVLPVMQDCASKRVGYALILSGGFRESGEEGIARERRLLEIARNAGIRIVGPNCLGFANIHAGVYAAFGSITREPKLKRGGVSLVTQSGGFGYSIALACAEEDIGFRHVIATGNESDMDTVDFIESLIDDAHTQCIVAYIEGARDGRRLLAAGRRARAAGKPILLWKGGVTDQGARAAASHTASMTGTYDFYRALYKQTGIVEITELHEIVDALNVLALDKPLEHPGIAVLGVSGGSAIVFADAGARQGLTLCDLSTDTQEQLTPLVPSMGAIHNPIDLTAGYFSEANQDKLDAALRAVLQDAAVGGVCVNLATTGAAGSLVAAQVLTRVARASAKPIVVFSSTPRSINGQARHVFAEGGVPVFASPSRAANALGVLHRWTRMRQRTHEVVPEDEAAASVALAAIQPGDVFSELESKRILAQAGVPVTHDVLVTTEHASEHAADISAMRFPLVAKIVSRDIAHKSEVGGVKLGLTNADDVRAAIAQIRANAAQHAPDAQIDGVLVSEMVAGGFELIVGSVNDAVFGPVVMVGAGGIYAEILKDVTYRLAPFDEATALDMLGELRCRPVFDGARGGAILDVAAAARALAALSRFVWAHRATVQEVDVNPLFLQADGVVAADALVVTRKLENGAENC